MKRKAVILVRSGPVRHHCQEDGGTKHFVMNLHFMLFAVQDGCSVFLFDDSSMGHGNAAGVLMGLLLLISWLLWADFLSFACDCW